MDNIYYITELSLPSDKAQSVHIFKMLDNLSNNSTSITLICPHKNTNYTYKKIKNDYNLHTKKKFEIKFSLKKNLKNNFLSRFIFSLKCIKLIKDRNSLIISRSIIASLVMSLFSIYHFLEIHQEIKGFSKFLFLKLNFFKSKYIIKNIFISKGIASFYKSKVKNYIVLHDGSDKRDFKIKYNPNKKVKNIYYFGSFYKGRGINFLLKLASICPNFNFHLVGKRNEKIKNYSKNVKIYSFMKLKKVLSSFKKADLLLMPYQKRVSISSDDYKDNISNFMSPIKMFEYLSTGIPIISSEKKVLKEILINKKNCIFVKEYENIVNWKKAINYISKKKKLRKKISYNALATAKKFSWKNRAKKIFSEYNLFKKEYEKN